MKQSRSMFYTRKHRYLLESAPVTSDTSDRHCSFHPSLSPCHTMLRTFASTPRCCAARSKRRARSGRPALSAASMAALRTASNGDFVQLVVDQQRPIRQRHNFESFMIPGFFFWRSDGYVLQKMLLSIGEWLELCSPSGNVFFWKKWENFVFSIIHLPSKLCMCPFCRSPNVLMKRIPNQWMPCFKKIQQVETNDSLGVRYFLNIATSSTQKTQNCVFIDYLDWLKGIRKSMNQGDSFKLWWRW